MPLNRKAGAKRLVDMATPMPEWHPDLDPCDEYVQEFPINEHTSYIQRIQHDERGRLVEWAVIQMYDGERVAVYDICHGKGFHIHFYSQTGAEIEERFLRSVDSYADSEACLDDAITRVSERWQENERRTGRGD